MSSAPSSLRNTFAYESIAGYRVRQNLSNASLSPSFIFLTRPVSIADGYLLKFQLLKSQDNFSAKIVIVGKINHIKMSNFC